MIEDKWLANVIFTTVRTKADLSRVKKAFNGDFQAGELSRALNTDRINDLTVRAWRARASNRKSTIVFCADLAHVNGLTHTFRDHGVDARIVTGDTAKVDRGNTLDEFKAGMFPVLVNCGVFTEGTDIPNIDCVLLARPTKSRNLLVQMIGRGMRLHPDKENCHVIDMVASLETGIVTTPTLFGLDPSELVEEADAKKLNEIKQRRALEQAQPQPLASAAAYAPSAAKGSPPGTITFIDYDSVEDLIEDTSGERHIRAISPYAWVQVGQDKYILGTSAGDFLTIEKLMDGAHFEVRVTNRLPAETMEGKPSKSPYRRPRVLATTSTFLDGVHAADTYATEWFPRQIIGKNQAWRKRPATEGQLAFLNRMRPADDRLLPETITKGRAGDMITKIKHGGRGWFKQIQTDRRRERRETDRVEALRSKERVAVGPLPA